MSHEPSPSTQQPYGLARVTRVWQVPRLDGLRTTGPARHGACSLLVHLTPVACQCGGVDVYEHELGVVSPENQRAVR